MKILANDGIAEAGKIELEEAGFTVITETVAKENLINAINNEGYEVILVRSATKIRKAIIIPVKNYIIGEALLKTIAIFLVDSFKFSIKFSALSFSKFSF